MADWARRLSGSHRPIVVVLGVGTFLSILAPYDTAALGWPWVWVYWTGLIAAGGVVGFGTGAFLNRWRPNWPQWVQYFGAAIAVSLPVTAMVFGLNAYLAGRLVWSTLPLTFFFVFVISAFVTGVSWVIDTLAERPAPGAPAPQAGAALLEKLPVRLREARIWALEAEDHYLRVRTDRGDALILMRLSDAAAACEALDGARTHRSWWVAREAVADARKGDGRGVLTLKDGAEAPVSRTYYPALRDSGWF